MHPVVGIFICYLIGSIPFGLLISRFYGIDITTKGSGNIGATNIARSVGKVPGIATLLLDAAKGYLASQLYLSAFWQISLDGDLLLAIGGLSAVIGHCFSIPGLLKGGKGVATGLGVLFAISPYTALVALAVFLASFLATKIVSISSMLASAASFFAYSIYFAHDNAVAGLLVLVLALLICYKHKENIARLITGTEPKFSLQKS